MTLDRITELIAEASSHKGLDCYTLVRLVQLDMLQVAKANLILSNNAKDLYRDLLDYVANN